MYRVFRYKTKPLYWPSTATVYIDIPNEMRAEEWITDESGTPTLVNSNAPYVPPTFRERKKVDITVGHDEDVWALSDQDTDYTYFLDDNCLLRMPIIEGPSTATYLIMSVADTFPPQVVGGDGESFCGVAAGLEDNFILISMKYASFFLRIDDTITKWVAY